MHIMCCLYVVVGDNILTAVSVSRKCQMVHSSNAVIEVKATPNTNGSLPIITYQLVGEITPDGMWLFQLNGLAMWCMGISF